MKSIQHYINQARENMESVDMTDVVPLMPRQPDCGICGDLGYISRNVPLSHPDFGKLFPCPSNQCAEGNRIRQTRIRKYFEYSDWPEGFAEIVEQLLAMNADEGVNQLWEAKWRSLEPNVLHGKDKAIVAAGCAVGANGKPFVTPESKGIAKMGLGLLGTYGTGKSWLLATVAVSLMAFGIPVVYIRTPNLLRKIQATYGTSQSAEDVIRAAQTVPVLFLDEFHLSKYTPDRLEKMEEILDWRHNRNLPYFIAANFKDLKELEALEKWGGWFGSRVRKDLHWYRMGGVALRQGGELYG